MKRTLHIDEDLLREAKSAFGATTDTDTVRLDLEALGRRAGYERLSGAARIRAAGTRYPAASRCAKGAETLRRIILLVPAIARTRGRDGRASGGIRWLRR